MAIQPVAKKDDTRQSLLKWTKKALRSRWFFRLLMLVWKIYQQYER